MAHKFLNLCNADDSDMSQAEVVRGIALGEYAPADVARFAEIIIETREELHKECEVLETECDQAQEDLKEAEEQFQDLAGSMYSMLLDFKELNKGQLQWRVEEVLRDLHEFTGAYGVPK